MIIFLFREIAAGGNKEKIRLSKVIFIGYLCLTIPIIVGILISFSFTDLIESIMCKLGFIVVVCFSYFILKNKSEGKIID
jgi:L-asparagine transporter-like permease